MSSSYDWHPSANSKSVFKVENRNVGWWVLLAIFISVIVHIILYIALGHIQRKERVAGNEEIVFRLKREQLMIDQDKLSELLDETSIPEDKPIKPEKLSHLDMVDSSLDEFDLMEKMKDEPIRLAPVETPQMVSNEPPKIPKKPGEVINMAASIDISSSELLSKDLAEMRNKLIDSSAAVSNNQPIIELNSTDDLSNTVDTDAFFQSAAAQAFGNNADVLIEGYSSLDDLISRTGGLPPGEEKIALPTDILFEYNESELRESARLSMMKLAFVVQTNPNAIFLIEGHTDSFGGEEFNRGLSLERAKAVRNWLVGKLRISDANIQVVGMGKGRPIVPTDGDKDAQALNRRVEIVVRSQ